MLTFLFILLIISYATAKFYAGDCPIRLSFINGIGYTKRHVDSLCVDLGSLFGINVERVRYCHNPTAMSSDADLIGYGKDLTQAGITQKLLKRDTPEVEALVLHLRELIDEVSTSPSLKISDGIRTRNESGRIVHIAHSQGALITCLALRQLSAREHSMLEVITFGGAAAVTASEFPHLRRRINYYSTNDPLLYIVPSAYGALRSGFASLLSSADGNGGEFIFLNPRSGDPLEDHQILGPTYSVAMAWEGQNFQITYGPTLSKSIVSTAMLDAVLALRYVLVPVKKAVVYVFGRFVALPVWSAFLLAHVTVTEILQALVAWMVHLCDVLLFRQMNGRQ